MRVLLNATFLGMSAAVVFISACRDPAVPAAAATPVLNGTFALSQVNGKTLPDTEALTISGAPGHPQCAILGTSGSLTLNQQVGKFSITMNARNACVNQDYLFLTEVGTYTQSGDSLSFAEPASPDSVHMLTGKIDSQTIVVRGGFRDFVFTR